MHRTRKEKKGRSWNDRRKKVKKKKRKEKKTFLGERRTRKRRSIHSPIHFFPYLSLSFLLHIHRLSAVHLRASAYNHGQEHTTTAGVAELAELADKART
jgi:hypothetical protein